MPDGRPARVSDVSRIGVGHFTSRDALSDPQLGEEGREGCRGGIRAALPDSVGDGSLERRARIPGGIHR